MALVPATFMDSFQSSMLKHHFLRYASSIPPKKQSFYKPPKITAFDGTKKIKRWNFGRVSSSCNSWLVNWNETHKEYKLKRPRAVIDYRNNGEGSGSDCEESSSSGSTMERIVQKLKKFGYVDEVSDEKESVERKIEKGSVEDIFYVEEGILPNSRGGFSEKLVYHESGNVYASNGEVSFPWERPKVNVDDMSSVRRRSRLSFAELTLPESEINRLRYMALRIKNKTRIKGSVTHEVVEKIHEKWKSSEVVRLKIDGTPALNMKRMHEILERKTGGLVVWRSGTSIALYRGVTYTASSSEKTDKSIYYKNGIPPESSRSAPDNGSISSSRSVVIPESESANTGMEKRNDPTLGEPNYEDETDKLLDSLGPRFMDWPGHGSLPVDADLLPGVLPGYQPPFRILPYGVRSTLGVKEATSLRRLARVVPPHFALGRSRQHQGLAAAMVKLWESSKIAKVALKRGVQLTTSERMAEDIKKLTGGILLSRNKDFLVFYRGKDFLSTDVSEALLEKERLANTLQDEEEQARLRASAFVTSSMRITDVSGTAGTLGETLDADARWGQKLSDDHGEKMMKEAEMVRHANLARKLQSKLYFAERKLAKAERALAKVEEFLNPSEHFADPDSITDEERFMFRKLGLRMKAYLILGRRGVFDGTVENMHLHWKYRELVKIMLKAQTFAEVKAIALSLEAESGGVLVSVDKVSKGYAIVVYRGKDYSRPSRLRPQNLLSKRKALARSIELQRHQALMNHILQVQTRVKALKAEMDEMENVKDRGDVALYDRLDSSYLSEDEDIEDDDVEGDDEDIDEDEDFETLDESGNSVNSHYSDESENVSEEKETEYAEL